MPLHAGVSLHHRLFMILLQLLMQQVKPPPKVVITYNNMCNLAKLRVAGKPLHSLHHWTRSGTTWTRTFYIKNHVSQQYEQCTPANIKSQLQQPRLESRHLYGLDVSDTSCVNPSSLLPPPYGVTIWC